MTNTDFRQLFHPLLVLHASACNLEGTSFNVRSPEPVALGARVDVLYGMQWACGTVVRARRLDAATVDIAMRAPCALDELEASCATRSSMP